MNQNQSKKIFNLLMQFAGFNVLLEIFRIIYSGQIGFVFLIWNLFLAFLPLVISYYLLKQGSGAKLENVCCFIIWLLLLPNAPYLITDFLHFGVRNDMPQWFDLMLLFCFALCGLMMGVVSIILMMQHLSKYMSSKQIKLLLLLVFIATGFGVYIGRYLRWNSWSVLTHPIALVQECGKHVLYPMSHKPTWLITTLMAVIVAWCFYFLKSVLKSDGTN